MSTKDRIEALILKIKEMLAQRLMRSPDEIRYKALLTELEKVEQEIRKAWPLNREFAQSTRFGLFAVRELEDEPELVDQLVALDKSLKSL
jgi:hypothetical protein